VDAASKRIGLKQHVLSLKREDLASSKSRESGHAGKKDVVYHAMEVKVKCFNHGGQPKGGSDRQSELRESTMYNHVDSPGTIIDESDMHVPMKPRASGQPSAMLRLTAEEQRINALNMEAPATKSAEQIYEMQQRAAARVRNESAGYQREQQRKAEREKEQDKLRKRDRSPGESTESAEDEETGAKKRQPRREYVRNTLQPASDEEPMDATIPPPPANPRGASPVDPLPPAGSITSIADSLDHNASATTGIDFDKFPAGKRARVRREAAKFQIGQRFRNAYHAVRSRSTARIFTEPPDVADGNLVRSMYYHEKTPPMRDVFAAVGVDKAHGYVFLTGQFQYREDLTVAIPSMAPDFEDGDTFYINLLTVTIPGLGKKGEGTWLEPLPVEDAPSPVAMDFVDVERSVRQYLHNSEMARFWLYK